MSAREMVEIPETVEAGPVPYGAELSLDCLPGVGAKTVALLRSHGIQSVADVANAMVEKLNGIPGVGSKKAEKLIESAQELIAQGQDG
jgi:DNA polymerase/3'-5' exonuclease PolX